MKKFKSNFAIIAFVLGAGAAFAGTHKSAKPDNVLWGRQQSGAWVQTTLGAHCTASTQVCKEYFPAGQDPNSNPSGGTIQTNNGFVN
jgi:hypothetical protein